jgi:hypothetical protein
MAQGFVSHVSDVVVAPTFSTSSIVKNHCRPWKQLVERYAEIGMRDVGQRAELVLEPIERFLACVAQRFQGDRRPRSWSNAS